MGRLPWFPKYILIPAAFAALGYWVVGPRLSGDPHLQKLVRDNPLLSHGKQPATEPAAESEPTPEASTTGTETTPATATPANVVAPTVSVKVNPAPDEDQPKPRRRKKRRHHTPPADPKPADEAPRGPDPASTPAY